MIGSFRGTAGDGVTANRENGKAAAMECCPSHNAPCGGFPYPTSRQRRKNQILLSAALSKIGPNSRIKQMSESSNLGAGKSLTVTESQSGAAGGRGGKSIHEDLEPDHPSNGYDVVEVYVFLH